LIGRERRNSEGLGQAEARSVAKGKAEVAGDGSELTDRDSLVGIEGADLGN
jgi:hypothetical protein